MVLPWEAVGFGMAAIVALTMAVAMCSAAGQADAHTRRDATGVPSGPSGPDDRTAAEARRALRARAAWVFANPTGHARLQRTGRHGAVTWLDAADALALRVAGLAINTDVPVVVPTANRGALDGLVLVAIAIPFADGRAGALVVAGGPGFLARPWSVEVLQELAVERAELGASAPVAVERRAS